MKTRKTTMMIRSDVVSIKRTMHHRRADMARCILVLMVTASLASWSAPSAEATPLRDIITGSEFLSVLMGSDPHDRHLVSDINKKEAPRLDVHDDPWSSGSLEAPTRTPRSNKEDRRNSLKVDLLDDGGGGDDLLSAGSSFYGDNNSPNDRLKNGFLEPPRFEDDAPKIIGVRVTSSVAVGRGSKPHPLERPRVDDDKKDSIAHKFGIRHRDSPTTWRPPLFRFINRDYYRGVPSNKQYVSALPESAVVVGANVDYIQQQKERELAARKKADTIHPYQRTISYHGPSKPRSYSYSSVINSFGDSGAAKLTTLNQAWASTKSESPATEATAGFVTIINHGDNTVEESKDEIKEPSKADAPAPNVPSLPIVYSEPAKVYSEPAKVYSEPEKVYSEPAKVYSEPAKVYSEPAKVYSEPAKVYSEPAKNYGEPAKVYSEPAKVYSEPAKIYHSLPTPPQPQQPQYGNYTQGAAPRGRNRGYGAEQNYEVDESISVSTNGRTHGVQQEEDKAAAKDDPQQKVGYVVEGRNFRKWRVEERTPEGFIVGEYGVVSHDDGSLRGVRYTADGEINPGLINDALLKFLSLQ